ncbi:MAG: hypothetical protein WAQ27_05125 [Candidatus Microsaccharimonas sp.]
MEPVPNNTNIVDQLYSEIPHSPILLNLVPAFEAAANRPYELQRHTDSNEGIQLLWQQGEHRWTHFEQLCLTLSRQSLSLTIAIDHHHNDGDISYLQEQDRNHLIRSTMVITPSKHSLYETHRFNGLMTGIYENEEAISKFTPKLFHTLGSFGLLNTDSEALKVS